VRKQEQTREKRSMREVIFDSLFYFVLKLKGVKIMSGHFIYQDPNNGGDKIVGTGNPLPTQLTGRNVKDETTLQNAATATGNGTAIYMGAADTFKITEISGTSTSRTIVFEVSNAENGTYSAVQGVRLSDLVMASQTSNNSEVWQIDGLAGLWFRARVSAVAGGNVTVKGKAVA
jgi:hypothetical protein